MINGFSLGNSDSATIPVFGGQNQTWRAAAIAAYWAEGSELNFFYNLFHETFRFKSYRACSSVLIINWRWKKFSSRQNAFPSSGSWLIAHFFGCRTFCIGVRRSVVTSGTFCNKEKLTHGAFSVKKTPRLCYRTIHFTFCYETSQFFTNRLTSHFLFNYYLLFRYDCPHCKTAFLSRVECFHHNEVDHPTVKRDRSFFCEICLKNFLDQVIIRFNSSLEHF